MAAIQNRSVRLAVETMRAIAKAIEVDQGNRYRQILGTVLPHIGDAYRVDEDPFRNHLGGSVIGQECGRAIWYGYRWFTRKKFEGRMIRLFNRGHLEEGRIVTALLLIGAKVYQQDANGKQFGISDHGGHFGGSGDGVVVDIPDLDPGVPALLECKTHNDKSFATLKKQGVRSAKPEHFIQMQVYLRKMQLNVALYAAANKNDDDLYMELIPVDPGFADQYIDRAKVIIFHKGPPTKISNSPGWLACTWCDHKPVCHLGALPERNCRTCIHSSPGHDGNWYCLNEGADPDPISKELMKAGCAAYEAFK